MTKSLGWWIACATSVALGMSVGAAPQQAPAPATPVPGAPAEAGRGRQGQGAGNTQPGAIRSGGAAGFVNPVMDTVPPELPKDLKDGGLLIFSKTNGYRDEPAIQASNAALVGIARKRGWPYFVTENAAIMNADQLKRFKVTVWNNTSGNTHDDKQREAFKTWLENGGAFVGLHGAGGDPRYDWAWYPETLIKAQFTEHSSRQLGTVHVEDRNSPIMKGIPENWARTIRDEWYSFKENPRTKGVHVLAVADEKSYEPGRTSMGSDHPLVWTHCVEKGRVFYSALGHPAASYIEEPLNLQLIENALAWALGQAGGPSCPAAK